MRNHRFLNSHIVNPANDRLCITVLDEPGAGGANHLYMISGFDTSTNPAKLIADEMDGEPVDLAIKQSGAVPLIFQNGAIGDVGVNGINEQALLAVLVDRLEGFQGGPYKSNYNADALYHLQAAMHALHRRTRDRMAQGIEGTMAVGTETRLGANVHGIGPDTDSDEDRSTDGIAAAVESASQERVREPEPEEPILKFFAFAHLPERLQEFSGPFSGLAERLVSVLPRNAERSVALRKLLEAKDAAVRAAL